MLPLRTEAIVLRAVNYGEADRIVTLLGRSTGKVSALARSARKSQRRFGGLGSASSGIANLRPRGGELWGFESFELSKPRSELALDLVSSAHAAYACELVERLCAPQQVDPETHDWLERMLDALVAGAPSAERLRVFEMGLLTRLGLAPGVDRCGACGRTDLPSVGARWQPETAMMFCGACASRGTPVDAETLAALARFAHADLDDDDQGPVPSGVNRACRNLLGPFIEHHVGAPLRSARFLAELARGGALKPKPNHPPESSS